MTTSYRQGADTWLIPVVIPADTVIGWEETAGPLTATIPAGTYWGTAGGSGVAGYPSLYNEIVSAMSGVSLLFGNAVTYTAEARTPRRSNLVGAGIAIKGSKADFLGIDLDTTTLDWGLLGFDDAVLYGLQASRPQATGSGREVVGYYCRKGSWTSPVWASQRQRTPRRAIEHSTTYTERADAYAVDYGDRATRLWSYEWVPAAHVYEDRAADPQYAEVAQLYTGDSANAFEAVWRALGQLDDVIVIHQLDGQPVALSPSSTRLYDVVRIADVAAAQDFGRVAQLLRTAGEWYRLEIDCVIRSGTNGY